VPAIAATERGAGAAAMAQVALAWVLAQPGITSVIVGAAASSSSTTTWPPPTSCSRPRRPLDLATALAPITRRGGSAMGIPAPNEILPEEHP
jgi:hypothetical protein